MNVTISLLGLDQLIGTTEKNLELHANEEVMIPFVALVPKAGVYNLQTLRFVVQQQDKEGGYNNASSLTAVAYISRRFFLNMLIPLISTTT